jgi:hypothetical protein
MIGKKVEKTVDDLSKLRRKLNRMERSCNLEYAANNIPLVPLVKEKARRRLRLLMPTEPSLVHGK